MLMRREDYLEDGDESVMMGGMRLYMIDEKRLKKDMKRMVWK